MRTVVVLAAALLVLPGCAEPKPGVTYVQVGAEGGEDGVVVRVTGGQYEGRSRAFDGELVYEVYAGGLDTDRATGSFLAAGNVNFHASEFAEVEVEPWVAAWLNFNSTAGGLPSRLWQVALEVPADLECGQDYVLVYTVDPSPGPRRRGEDGFHGPGWPMGC